MSTYVKRQAHNELPIYTENVAPDQSAHPHSQSDLIYNNVADSDPIRSETTLSVIVRSALFVVTRCNIYDLDRKHPSEVTSVPKKEVMFCMPSLSMHVLMPDVIHIMTF